jgi:hypothetical protein
VGEGAKVFAIFVESLLAMMANVGVPKIHTQA